jgi:hypothetical protein
VDHQVEENRRLFQLEEGLEKDKMAGAAHRQKLRQPLNNSQKDRLEYSDFSSPPPSPSEDVKKLIWFFSTSFRRKPESSVLDALRTAWTPDFTPLRAGLKFNFFTA